MSRIEGDSPELRGYRAIEVAVHPHDPEQPYRGVEIKNAKGETSVKIIHYDNSEEGKYVDVSWQTSVGSVEYFTYVEVFVNELERMKVPERPNIAKWFFETDSGVHKEEPVHPYPATFQKIVQKFPEAATADIGLPTSNADFYYYLDEHGVRRSDIRVHVDAPAQIADFVFRTHAESIPKSLLQDHLRQLHKK